MAFHRICYAAVIFPKHFFKVAVHNIGIYVNGNAMGVFWQAMVFNSVLEFAKSRHVLSQSLSR